MATLNAVPITQDFVRTDMLNYSDGIPRPIVQSPTPITPRVRRAKRIVRPWEDASTTPSSAPSLPGGAPLTPPPTPRATSSPPPGLATSAEVIQGHGSFLQAISELQTVAPLSDPWLSTMASCYLSQVLRLEAARSQALLHGGTYSGEDLFRVQAHYDGQRLALLQQARHSLSGYSSCIAAASSPRVGAVHHPTTSTITTAAFSPIGLLHQQRVPLPMTPPTTPQPGYQFNCSTPSLNFSISPNTGSVGSSDVSSPDSSPSPRPKHRRLDVLTPDISSDDSTSGSITSTSGTPTKRRSCTGKRFLGQAAVGVLEEWYTAHQQYPYANAAQVRHLAGSGGISFTQVRKWLANRRVRAHNTLTFKVKQETYGQL